ncbi:MAG: NitT/TauT family transport system permease protein [Thermoanaerobacteraceae bacterium]|nr:NitT/TauT family transport system permease protein [Thermoanaerobacteraceae bacterium]
MKKKRLDVIELICAIVSITAFLALWHLGTRGELGKLMPGPIPAIQLFLKTLFGETIGSKTLIVHIAYSLMRVMVGYMIGAVAGVVLGLSMGWSRLIEAIFAPLFRIIRPIPPIAWIPISIMWIGLGEDAKIFLIFLASFCNVTLNAWSGAKSVDQNYINAAKMLGAKQTQVLFTIVLPASIPPIFAGLQVALSSSWATVLAAEMVRSSEGLGWIIIAGMNNNDMIQIMAGILTIGIVGMLLSVIFRKVEAILCRWNKSEG